MSLFKTAGFAIVAREQFLHGVVAICAYTGAPNSTLEEVAAMNRATLEGLRKRVRQYGGDYVIFDPYADADGWLLVGDANDIVHQTENMIKDLL